MSCQGCCLICEKCKNRKEMLECKDYQEREKYWRKVFYYKRKIYKAEKQIKEDNIKMNRKINSNE